MTAQKLQVGTQKAWHMRGQTAFPNWQAPRYEIAVDGGRSVSPVLRSASRYVRVQADFGLEV
jgi:hypothetical protein